MDNQQNPLRELELFAGAGGGILGGILLGHEIVCAVEYNAYARSVLLARQNDGTLPPFPIWDDVCTFDGKPWRGIVDVVSGGFPCQDISAAGKGAGIEGERSGLWREMARIIGEVRPRFVFVENSPMLTSRGMGTVLGDLSAMGFDARWGVVSAADTGAPHKRERIWIMAYSYSTRMEERVRQDRQSLDREGGKGRVKTIRSGSNVAYSKHSWVSERWRTLDAESKAGNSSRVFSHDGSSCKQQEGKILADTMRRGLSFSKHESGQVRSENNAKFGALLTHKSGWPTEPNLGRVADGVAFRVDRLKAIGNGQVPRVAATAWRILSDADAP